MCMRARATAPCKWYRRVLYLTKTFVVETSYHCNYCTFCYVNAHYHCWSSEAIAMSLYNIKAIYGGVGGAYMVTAMWKLCYQLCGFLWDVWRHHVINLFIGYVEECTNTNCCSASVKWLRLSPALQKRLTFTTYWKQLVYWSFGTWRLHNTNQYSGHSMLMG